MRVRFRFRTQFDFILLIFVENLRNTLFVCLSVGRHNLRAVATIDDDNEYANVGLCPWEQTHVSAKWNDHWNVNKMTSLYVLATRMSHAKTTKNKSTNFACVLVVGKQRPGFVCICFYEFLMIRHRRRSTAAACAAGRTFLLFSSHSSDRLELRCAVATIGLNMKSQFRGSQLLIDEAEQKTNANTYSTTQLNSITLRANCHSHLLSLSLSLFYSLILIARREEDEEFQLHFCRWQSAVGCPAYDFRLLHAARRIICFSTVLSHTFDLAHSWVVEQPLTTRYTRAPWVAVVMKKKIIWKIERWSACT